MKLHPQKFKLHLSEVIYAGHHLSAEGLKVDSAKVSAITDMPAPSGVQPLRRFLGMVNYLARFVKNLSEKCSLLHQLTKDNAEWQWTADHQRTFDDIKAALTSAPILAYFDPAKDLTVQCDASSLGIGAAILQDTKILA